MTSRDTLPPLSPSPAIDVVVPVHNEEQSIARTLLEFHAVVSERARIPIRFVICEDGSTDATVDVVRGLADRLPLCLLTSPGRKGYSRAVCDGLRAASSEWVACIDGDGQCDPGDFAALVARRAGNDVVYGCRTPRNDSLVRRLYSAAFGVVYRRFFPVALRDPSCPFVLVNRRALQSILAPGAGVLRQGFWWEFAARATALGLRIEEVPVHHRARASGTTQVYRPGRITSIAIEHLAALRVLHRELNGGTGSAGR